MHPVPILRLIWSYPSLSDLAGKDRAGIFAALYLSVSAVLICTQHYLCSFCLKFLGVSDEDVAKDYTLTTYGIVPALPALTARLGSQKVFQENKAGAANLIKSK